MSKVYLHDEATGVTVRDWNGKVGIDGAAGSMVPSLDDGFTPAQFRAVIEGGLRWMLENDGFDAANDVLVAVVKKWQTDGRPKAKHPGD